MLQQKCSCAVLWRSFTGGLLGVVMSIGSFAAQAGASDPFIWKIEEDWELVVNEPDPSINSPQVTFFTCPTMSDGDTYFQLQMNYFADTFYSSGGFHVAAVRSENLLDQARSQNRQLITVSGDRIVWTSVMATIDGELLFAVKDGYGDDWGPFGGPEYLVRMPAQGTDTLADYSPSKSVEMVDIGFGGNRVASVVLKRARLFASDGQITTVELNASP